MRNSKTDEAVYRRIADDSGLELAEVRKAVLSFFDNIVLESRKLPFDDPTRIYARKKFHEYDIVRCIPYIGRIGTNYNKYLKWRANVADRVEMVLRSEYRMGLSGEEIEKIAKRALAGEMIEKRGTQEKRKIPFKRVWLVGVDGKKQARQVIPKEKTNNDV